MQCKDKDIELQLVGEMDPIKFKANKKFALNTQTFTQISHILYKYVLCIYFSIC